MKDIMLFSNHVVAQFDNNYDNMLVFNDHLMNASRRNYATYGAEETNTIIRNGFDKILGINFKAVTPMQRRQAMRLHGAEVYSLVEDVILDKMTSGWTEANAKFMQFVEDKNIADGDKNEFFVEDKSLLVVSKFAGQHADIVRQKVQPGKAFTIDTSWYVIKVYADFEMFQLGKIDFADMIDRMYKSIEQNRYAALFTTFMTIDQQIPAALVYDGAVSTETKGLIIDKIEAVKAATGKEVILVGTRTAVQKLQDTVNYNMFSDAMKDERHNNGTLGVWEGYECLALSRVNKVGTLESVFSAADNKKIYVLPVDPDFKPIKRVNEGDVIYSETGMDGKGNMDMTMAAEIRYQEGLGVVVNELFGEIKATN